MLADIERSLGIMGAIHPVRLSQSPERNVTMAEERVTMKASDLIAAVREQVAIRGDLPVLFVTDDGSFPVQRVNPRQSTEREPQIEIYGDWQVQP